MSSRELERVEVMGRVASGALKLKHTAEMLEMSYQHIKRLWRRYRKKGAEGLKTRGELENLLSEDHPWRQSYKSMQPVVASVPLFGLCPYASP